MNPWLHLAGLLTWTLVLAFIFAKVEVNIEGKDGWGKNLPTWRIEDHWLLKVFWGGRAMTGYHAWMFPFICLIFHTPAFVTMEWSLQLEARVLAMIAIFWIAEDFLWFVINPAFGIRKFNKRDCDWHKRWILGAPIEYWIFLVVSGGLLWYSFRP